ncbi:MAG: hypothetical protein N2508_02030 [Anaerolineae bacterium]|nr:hypothetical protein [Anaerolineae bacterium]
MRKLPVLLATAMASGWAAWVAESRGRLLLLFTLLSALVFTLWWYGLAHVWRAVRSRRYLHLLSLPGLIAGLGLYLWFSLWLMRPVLLPQRTTYDFIANLEVTARLVDPALLKVERWDILGRELDVLFVHPAPSGSTALVYPVKLAPRTALRAELALAPEAWAAEGDGVTFSVYVEDEAGMHLLYSRYVDPKHHQADRYWLPIRVDLSPFSGKLVRLILVTGPGPAGDSRYDWAGWGEPRLEQPIWP